MSEPLDPFDPAALRLPQDFTETANVKKLLETIPVGRFNKQDFFRVHPDPGYRLDSVGVLEIKDEREKYLVVPALSADLAEEFETQWVRVVPNMSLGAYEISVALNGLPDPVFPDLLFRELLRIAFRDRIIDREDHPVIQQLRGAA